MAPANGSKAPAAAAPRREASPSSSKVSTPKGDSKKKTSKPAGLEKMPDGERNDDSGRSNSSSSNKRGGAKTSARKSKSNPGSREGSNDSQSRASTPAPAGGSAAAPAAAAAAVDPEREKALAAVAAAAAAASDKADADAAAAATAVTVTTTAATAPAPATAAAAASSHTHATAPPVRSPPSLATLIITLLVRSHTHPAIIGPHPLAAATPTNRLIAHVAGSAGPLRSILESHRDLIERLYRRYSDFTNDTLDAMEAFGDIFFHHLREHGTRLGHDSLYALAKRAVDDAAVGMRNRLSAHRVADLAHVFQSSWWALLDSRQQGLLMQSVAARIRHGVGAWV